MKVDWMDPQFWEDNDCPETAQVMRELYGRAASFDWTPILSRVHKLVTEVRAANDNFGKAQHFVGRWECPRCVFADTRAEQILWHVRQHEEGMTQ